MPAHKRSTTKTAKKISTTYARDRLINCFETANKEINNALNQKVPEKELKARVRLFVGDAFRKCDVDFNNPSKEGLLKAMELCKKNTEKMLGKKGAKIVEKHYNEMLELFSRIE
ncbi:MAG: hypothetical protein ACP5RM_02285 [Candidatus Micrarchaeia archaeon]